MRVWNIPISLSVLFLTTSVYSSNTFTCRAGINASAGDIPQIAQSTKIGQTLLVCGGVGNAKYNGQRSYSEFEVYSVDSSQNASGSLFTAGANQEIMISKIADGLRFSELITVYGKAIPTFSFDISCTGQSCVLNKTTCVYQKPAMGSLQPLAEVARYVNGTKRGQIADESVILSLSDLALAGNPDAIAIFINKPDDLRVDGASGEDFDNTHDLLTRLKESSCL